MDLMHHRDAALLIQLAGGGGRPPSSTRKLRPVCQPGGAAGKRVASSVVSLNHQSFTSPKPEAPTQLVPAVVSPTGY
jgi:hypothetical protein